VAQRDPTSEKPNQKNLMLVEEGKREHCLESFYSPKHFLKI
jgi:hypothetical protein